jgi:hypothetical protein
MPLQSISRRTGSAFALAGSGGLSGVWLGLQSCQRALRPWPKLRTRCDADIRSALRVVWPSSQHASDAPCLITGDQSSALVTHAFSFRDTFRFARSFPPVVMAEAASRGFQRLLSWGSSKIAPPPIQALPVHSRDATYVTSLRLEGCPPPSVFRPCRSTRLRRFAPRKALRVYCTPLPAMGFATFPPRSLTSFRRRMLAPEPSQMALTPSEAFPFPAAAPCHHGHCPLAVDACFL